MHRINASHSGKQALAQLKQQLNFRAPVSKQPHQKWMRDCTGLILGSKQKVGLCTYELSTVHLPSAHTKKIGNRFSADPPQSGLENRRGISNHKRATVFLRARGQAITLAPPTPCAFAQRSIVGSLESHNSRHSHCYIFSLCPACTSGSLQSFVGSFESHHSRYFHCNCLSFAQHVLQGVSEALQGHSKATIEGNFTATAGLFALHVLQVVSEALQGPSKGTIEGTFTATACLFALHVLQVVSEAL